MRDLATLEAEANAFLAASDRTTPEGADAYRNYRSTVDRIEDEFGNNQAYLTELKLSVELADRRAVTR